MSHREPVESNLTKRDLKIILSVYTTLKESDTLQSRQTWQLLIACVDGCSVYLVIPFPFFH